MVEKELKELLLLALLLHLLVANPSLSEYQLGRSKVWFCVKFDVKAKKITSAKTGRISES
jgi:hypothetical protein